MAHKNNSSTPVEITSRFNLGVGEAITEVALGSYHSSAITSEGRIFTWGYNYSGQLGDDTQNNSSTPVEITSRFNLGVGETITEVALGECSFLSNHLDRSCLYMGE